VDAASAKRGAQWPIGAKLRGKVHRLLRRGGMALPANSGLIVPEVFSPAVARALPALLAATRGPRVALFHDAIALKFPELTPTKTVARFPGYLLELLMFDGIAAVSEDSRAALIDYWHWLGVETTPPVQTITLGIDRPKPTPRSEIAPTADAPVVLSIGSVEGRKNHIALLEACETLWASGKKFTLHLIGLAQPQTGAEALARIRALQAAGRALRYDGPVNDAAVEAAYSACAFTVYPSRVEGFGLPVVESVAHGKPCICSGRGALGESARGGGCVALDEVDAGSIAHAMGRLLEDATELAALAAAARERRFKTWSDYAAELFRWMHGLPHP
jgi:glycosyltransferase involved in cell wall biosynthesis